MPAPQAAVRLQIYTSESARREHQPLYEALMLKARELHLSGATLLRGPMGFGKSNVMHSDKFIELASDLPLIIEIVDVEEKINAFLLVLDQTMKGGFVTLEKVQVIDYRVSGESPPSSKI